MGMASSIVRHLKNFDSALYSGVDKVGSVFAEKIPGAMFKESKDGLPKLSGTGWAIGSLGIVGGLGVGAARGSEYAGVGRTDGKIYSPTPDYSPYLQMKTPSSSYSGAPAGADGSLVFALDRTKNGGFL